MNERTTNTDMVIAAALWLLVVFAFAAAAGTLALGYWKVAILIAEAACIFSAVAAVRHVRCYSIRLAELVRHSAGLVDRDAPAPVHSLR